MLGEEVVSLRANSQPTVSHKNRHPHMEVVEGRRPWLIIALSVLIMMVASS